MKTKKAHFNKLKVTWTNYDQELRKLIAKKESHGRNSIDKYIFTLGHTALLEMFGNLENFRQMLLDAGYSDKYTYRVIRKLKDEIEFNNSFK